MLPLFVLSDANILVKDVVSFVLFDLAKAGVMDLRWVPRVALKDRSSLPSQKQFVQLLIT